MTSTRSLPALSSRMSKASLLTSVSGLPPWPLRLSWPTTPSWLDPLTNKSAV